MMRIAMGLLLLGLASATPARAQEGDESREPRSQEDLLAELQAIVGRLKEHAEATRDGDGVSREFVFDVLRLILLVIELETGEPPERDLPPWARQWLRDNLPEDPEWLPDGSPEWLRRLFRRETW